MEDDFFYGGFANRIRRRRQIVGKTGAEVARAIEMTQPQYNLLEQGKKQLIRPSQLAKLAIELLTTADYLLGLSEDMGAIPPGICPEPALSVAGVTLVPTPTFIGEDS
jgi:transcriptional regulator with XRE-family HTH domain